MSEKFQTVSFDLYSSVMGITGLGLVWRAAAKTYDVSALPGEVFLATGLAVFLVLTGIQLLRLVFCRQIILAEWHSRASKNFFCAATISGIAAVAAQIFFLTCTFRRWLIDQLDTHEISPVWLIPMVGNASPAFAGVDLGFPGLSKMLLFSALLCWALFMPLILWRIVFVRPVTPQKAMPGLAIMVSAPAVIAVGLYCIYGGMNDVIEFMAWTALFFAIVLISLWRRMIPDTFGRIWWGFTFPSTALASALIRVDAASMTTLNHTLALAALTFATFVVCSIIVMTVRQSLLTLCWGRHAKHSG
ncbi:TPA: C4-dicarboxylate transporter [Klebsiella pneumoniae]